MPLGPANGRISRGVWPDVERRASWDRASAIKPMTPRILEMARRIVLAASGSLGDIYPYLAIGLGLKDRGHDAVLATCECHLRWVEDAGLAFRPVQPDGDWIADPRVMARYAVPRVGLMKTVLGRFLPVLRRTYDDLLDASQGADLLVSHPLCYAAPIAAEATGIAWASSMITPLGFFSAWDPPAYAFAPILSARSGPWYPGLGGVPPRRQAPEPAARLARRPAPPRAGRAAAPGECSIPAP